MNTITVKVVDSHVLEQFLASVHDGDAEDLMVEQFPEASNDTYHRLYMAPNRICPRPLDAYLPQIREALEAGLTDYVLVRFSW